MKGMIDIVSTKGKGYIIFEAASPNITPAMISEEQNVVRFNAELQEADMPNRNRRIYSKDAIDSAIKHYSIQEKLKTKTFFGESGHPLSDDPKRQMYIDQRNISHIVTNLWWDNNKLMGSVETADTLAGKDMRGLVMQGSQAAFSMRGMSDNVRKDGQYSRVGSPLMIVSYDYVLLPSHANSYMVRESSNLSEATQAMLNPSNQKLLSEGLLTPYNASDLLKHVTNSSSNVAEMVEAYGFEIEGDLSNVSIDTKKQILSIKEGNDRLKVFLEDSLKQDLDDYYSSFLLS